MLYMRLPSDEEYNRLELNEDGIVFMELIEKYPDESAEALADFVEFHEWATGFSFDKLKFLFVIYEYAELIEWIDDYIDDEVLVNFFVEDCSLTDLGLYKCVVCNGYSMT